MTVNDDYADASAPGCSEMSELARPVFERPPFLKSPQDYRELHDWHAATAYRESLILNRYRPQCRDPWTIFKIHSLPEAVIGPWAREGVRTIDLTSLLKVDEWCECEAQLRVHGASLSERKRRAIKADAAWLEGQLADYPAHTIFGVIAKLMIWRRRNAKLLAKDRSSGKRHVLAYSAYADLFRLTGLLALSTLEDGKIDDDLLPIKAPLAKRRKKLKLARLQTLLEGEQ